ncbi:C6 transcription factor [Pochonia chlamydosporia 170]|uniref:C6 transcription factor n=1 Tax=Pochonia chlamydosporia 170 TaxID=1380566 RepID=A0A179F4B4_METCM|nr:C6 transcription factor [Pochonia chlamydosporia 170]OAQ60245.1 C6 transcription factor [Pochonia chlamydosporia 170]
MAGLGEDYGSMMVRLEQTAPLATSATTSMFVLQHGKVMAALQSFSSKLHPWYPILEDKFSECISSFMANAFERRTDTFLVLMVLASGTIAQYESHSLALEDRPDAMYLNAAMEMLHLVILEQTMRSVQCLVAASIHYYLLLKPIQAHDLAMLAIKKAQNLHMSGALQHDLVHQEHWIRVYRIALLIEGELVIPLQLADSNAWDTEEEIPLPTGTDIWSYENDAALLPADSPGTTASVQSDDVITYLLAEIAMRRMLRRNTTAISISTDGSAEYAPLIAKELESQLEQWFSFLPEPLRFSREFDDKHHDHSLQTPFLRTQYWACMVSFYWPAVVQVMEAKQLTETTANGCRLYFKSFREFVRSAVRALGYCLPNKWTIYAR